MKKLIPLLIVVFVLAISLAVFAVTPQTNFRVVNISSLGQAQDLDDAELIDMAEIGIGENPKIFPTLTSMSLKVDKFGSEYNPGVTMPAGSLTFSGSISEEENMEFISLPRHDQAGKYDLAIVRSDKSIIKIDDEIVVDYANRTIKTYKPVRVEDGDTVLIFVKDVVETHFGDEKEEPEWRPPWQRDNDNDPTHDNRGRVN